MEMAGGADQNPVVLVVLALVAGLSTLLLLIHFSSVVAPTKFFNGQHMHMDPVVITNLNALFCHQLLSVFLLKQLCGFWRIAF